MPAPGRDVERGRGELAARIVDQHIQPPEAGPDRIHERRDLRGIADGHRLREVRHPEALEVGGQAPEGHLVAPAGHDRGAESTDEIADGPPDPAPPPETSTT